MVNGYPINWALPSGSKLQQHPLYIKYSSKTIATIIAELANLKADLSGVTYTGASLYGADLQGANLTDTKLESKSNLTNVKLDGVIYCRTKMPWGELNDGCPNSE